MAKGRNADLFRDKSIFSPFPPLPAALTDPAKAAGEDAQTNPVKTYGTGEVMYGNFVSCINERPETSAQTIQDYLLLRFGKDRALASIKFVRNMIPALLHAVSWIAAIYARRIGTYMQVLSIPTYCVLIP